jgi:hypothetical protein
MEKHMEYNISEYCRRVRGEHENHIQKLKQKNINRNTKQIPSTSVSRI